MQRREFITKGLKTSTGLLLTNSMGKAGFAAISAGMPGAAVAPVASLSARVDVRDKGEPFVHFWSKCVGAGRAAEGLRASWLEQLELAKKNCGFEYCRFHGLFHDDMFVYREVNGQPFFNWQYIDDLFDRMLAIGVRPFVELSYMPAPLASTANTTFWWKAHSTPPNDYAKWGKLVSAFTQHCVDRYGITEVQSWYFEVWNEPDLHGFWDGTKSQYFELYKTSVGAVRAVNPQLRVGGPATSNFVPDDRFDGETEDKSKHKTLTTPDINTLEWRGVWIKDFLEYCHREGLPVDFVSTHPYPTDWAIDPETKKGAGRVRRVNATREDMEWLRGMIAASAYPHAEVHLTEWSSSPSSRDPAHDSLPVAAYIIKANLDGIGLANSLSYWTFTDVFEETGAGNSIFHGGFGMINYQGIPKPSFHAYRMLHQLGDEIVRKEEGLIVTRHRSTGKITALLYHYPAERKDVVDNNVETILNTGLPRKFVLSLTGLKPSASIRIESLDRTHGFAYSAWKSMGSPEPPTREQTAALKKEAWATLNETIQAEKTGVFSLERTLQPWTCVLINEA